MLNKDELKKHIDSHPEKLTAQELAYEMETVAKVAASCEDIDAGRLIPHDEVMEEAETWLYPTN